MRRVRVDRIAVSRVTSVWDVYGIAGYRSWPVAIQALVHGAVEIVGAPPADSGLVVRRDVQREQAVQNGVSSFPPPAAASLPGPVWRNLQSPARSRGTGRARPGRPAPGPRRRRDRVAQEQPGDRTASAGGRTMDTAVFVTMTDSSRTDRGTATISHTDLKRPRSSSMQIAMPGAASAKVRSTGRSRSATTASASRPSPRRTSLRHCHVPRAGLVEGRIQVLRAARAEHRREHLQIAAGRPNAS